jgi:hypothetical protein
MGLFPDFFNFSYSLTTPLPPHKLSTNEPLPQVRSGMLIMPNPTIPNAVWEVAETSEMREVVGLYGKTYHLWQVDRGDELPLGVPMLMGSFAKDEQVGLAFFLLFCRCGGLVALEITSGELVKREEKMEEWEKRHMGDG